MPLAGLDWFTGGPDHPYHTLFHCMAHDRFWVCVTVALDLAVASGYLLIALHWWKNQRHLPPIPAKKALGNMRNIFLFCGVCGYIFIPVKMFWPAWRLYDLFMAALVYFTWRYAWGARDLKVIYNEMGRSRQLESDLEKSREESGRKSFFLNAISHDLRTPLNGMMLQANLAEVGLADNDTETVAAAVAEIRNSARATADLLNEFLEYARLDWSGDACRVERFELGPMLRDVVNLSAAAAEEKGISLRGSAPAGLYVQTDRNRLQRVVLNLVANAVKFTDRGGVRVEVERTGDLVEVHVIDTGVGIEPQVRERLFEEFFQLNNGERDRRKGFGLGLTIARRLARQLGGDVTVDSSPGRGSRFTVALPGAARAAAAEARAAAPTGA